MAVSPVKIGIIGCGNISGAYLEAAKKFEILDVAVCADLLVERAQAQAEAYGIPKACGVDELLADPEIEIVINLTIPKAHYSVAKAALEAGKNVHNEKPIAITREEGKELLELARAKGLRLGGAPDTFLGGGIQTCRKLIDDGAIGEIVGATAFMMGWSPETWHPDPEFIYKKGAGPLFDMGPYYLTTLINLLGPIQRVTGTARNTFPKRTITSQPKYGTVMDVEVPTFTTGVLEFANDARAVLITTFDVRGSQLPCIEIYGSQGTLSVPDPNCFCGPVRLLTPDCDWTEVPLTHGYIGGHRSIGVADMAYAIRSGRPHRANGDLAYHVLDIMHAIHDAAQKGKHIELASTCERPAALPVGLVEGKLDE